MYMHAYKSVLLHLQGAALTFKHLPHLCMHACRDLRMDGCTGLCHCMKANIVQGLAGRPLTFSTFSWTCILKESRPLKMSITFSVPAQQQQSASVTTLRYIALPFPDSEYRRMSDLTAAQDEEA